MYIELDEDKKVISFSDLKTIENNILIKDIVGEEILGMTYKNCLFTRSLHDLQALKISDFKTKYLEAANKDFTYKNEIYKGGEFSASAIARAITLAKALGETNCFIVAKNDTKTKYSFDDVLELSALIAKQWRDNWFKYKALKVRINNAKNESDLDLIEWN